ncbi:MAG: MBL fold metallo-hydrolase [Chitinophagaceae bacterium]|nr:MBL fold metallo-hydrolase [Chitinophagaceae bacterium]
MRIIPLSEGAFTIDQSKEFIPFKVGEDDLSERSHGSLLVEIQPFLVITDNDYLLLDTGLGFEDQNGTMQIHQLLEKNGISPDQITKVLMSHLHKDHSGGILMPDKKTPSFRKAKYYINRNEYEIAINGHSSSYRPDDIQALKGIEFLEGNGSISSSIEYIFTGAHSPYHQAFKIKENNQVIFFGGDVAPQLQQMRTKFRAKYDYEPVAAMELRQNWWQEGEKEHWTFLFYHDIKYPSYQFKGQ